MTTTPYATREEWLNAALPLLNGLIADNTDLKPAKKLLMAVGWPRRDRGGVVVGQCYASKSSKGTNHIFVSPMLGNPVEVLGVLLHELIHAADDCKSVHNGPFRRAWRAVGFVDKPTTSVPGKDLKATLREMAATLGKYPHSRLTPAMVEVKKQTTRMLKVECDDCGCVVRMTRKWLDEAGPPTCGCGGEMLEVASE